MDSVAFEFHIAREARDRYGFADLLFSVTGNVIIADLAASRDLAHRMNAVRDATHHPELTVNPGALNAMGLLDEVSHVVLAQYRIRRDPRAARLLRHPPAVRPREPDPHRHAARAGPRLAGLARGPARVRPPPLGRPAGRPARPPAAGHGRAQGGAGRAVAAVPSAGAGA